MHYSAKKPYFEDLKNAALLSACSLLLTFIFMCFLRYTPSYFLLIILALYYRTEVYAQNQRIIEGYLSPISLSLVVFPEGQRPLMIKEMSFLRDYLNLTNHDELRLILTEKDKLGHIHQKFQRFYNNIKVEHDIINVHSDNGWIYALNGELKNISDPELQYSFSESKALERALTFVNASSYMWQNPVEETFLKQETNNPEATYFPEGEMVYVADYQKDNNVAYLAYKFNIYAESPLSRNYIYVSPETGTVIAVDAIIRHANAPATAQTRYNGSQTITTDSYLGNYRLRSSRGTNAGVQTFNMKSTTSYANAVDFIDADNNWNEYDNAAKDNIALDAHWAAEKTYDYFLSQHNRNSYNNTGGVLKSYVHYGVGYDNAFWDGSRMTYGDGKVFKPLASLDISAHEFAHGICQHTANLVYCNEAGAISESLSDIWAACIENTNPDSKAIWLIGEDVEQRAGHIALRSMSSPNIEGQPDTYNGTYWANTKTCNPVSMAEPCGVHVNSGIMNYWFYLLVNGGAGINDLGQSFSVSGVGISAAAQIVYRAETSYMGANETFMQARVHLIQSAIDLYGANSAQVIAVTNAWHAVGVGVAYQLGGMSCGIPSAHNAINITINNATIAWTSVIGANNYSLQYKLSTTQNWTTIDNIGTSSFNIKGLKSGSSYDYRVAASCATLVGVYTAVNHFETLAENQTCSDMFTDNSNFAKAANLPVNIPVTGLITSRASSDYFYFSNSITQRNIRVSLSHLPADYDLKLYTDNGLLLGTSQNEGIDNEVIVYNNAPIGIYRIKVYGYDGAADAFSCYTLQAETSNVQYVRVGNNEPEIISEGNNWDKQVLTKQSLAIAPNPFSDKIILSIISNDQTEAQLFVSDAMGKVVSQREISLQRGENGLELDLGDFANGVYILRLSIGETNLSHKVLKY